MLILALLLAGPPEVAVFGDWAVGCDNGRACTAIALQPMDRAGEEPTQASIVRDPDPQANLNIGVKLRTPFALENTSQSKSRIRSLARSTGCQSAGASISIAGWTSTSAPYSPSIVTSSGA